MKEFFKAFRFRGETLRIISIANEIIEDYQRQGFDLTLRQLYYQFVAKDILPNSQKSYNKLGNIINDARLNGDLDWSAIKDRTRSIENDWHWDNPAQIIQSSVYGYHIDTRADQEFYLECWVEKEALVGVVAKACKQIGIPYFACRGYVSQTAMYDAAERFREKHENGQRSIILHLGDHDPSGIDMTRDIKERLNDTFGASVGVKRIALNMDQIEQYAPPPNPAKLTDSRVDDYIRNYGEMSWELDALDPRTLTKLIVSEADRYTEKDKITVLEAKQKDEKEIITKCVDNWDKVVELFGGN